ncbi:uncharacterized protein TNCT_611911 [Trichonephila clavata]|uniref:Uncharacterized protein n=1 Tax=Trichonephila clavata TaxID=2740835 RepID=A0A8X6G4K8_TRICU|nr:uncharacterized protein TNCT_611911 [Trichonephila clavata]
MEPMSLYNICKWEVAYLLKNLYWIEICDNDAGIHNPFSDLPTLVIQELMDFILKLLITKGVRVTELYPLLTSGRLENFRLCDVILTSEEFVSIFSCLALGCGNLRYLTLRNVFFSGEFSGKSYEKKAALECILSMTPNIELIESCVEFDLKVIQKCNNLKVLKLNFVSSAPVYSFLEQVNRYFLPHSELRVLEFFEDERHRISHLDLIPILHCCPTLKEINTDISRTLELLHRDEMVNGTLNAKYNLQKCFLGNSFVEDGFATLTAVRIAALTCPDMKEVNILVSDTETIYALSDFKNLETLLIQWELLDGGDFNLGIVPLLKERGEKLKSLQINNFYAVDFAAVGLYCPHVESLKFEFWSENGEYDDSLGYFRELKYLFLELMESDQYCSEKALMVLLSSCTNLIELQIRNVKALSGSVLKKILQRNPLSNIKKCIISDCNLSEEDSRDLLASWEALRHIQFEFSSS